MKKNRCALAYANAPLGTQWGKRILSTLLAVVLCLGLLPGAAFAAGTYTHADVNAVLDRVVKNETTVGTEDKAYDKDNDGKLTSWDAKLMLDDIPSSIKVNAMQIDGNGTEQTNWVSLEIQDGKLVRTTTINKFWGTLSAFTSDSIYPEAAALNGEDLVLRATYSSNGGSNINTLLQVDPDSFVAREQPRPSDPAADSYYITTWDDATTLSNGQLLGVYTDSSEKAGISFFLMDGENNKKITISESISEFPKLVGIAAGKDTSSNEILYGITKDGGLYSFTLTDGAFSIDDVNDLGKDVFPDKLEVNESKSAFLSASLLYDNASGYLLAAVTYVKDISGSTASDNVGSALYLIDPAHPGSYVTVTQLDGVVLNSLYQYTQKSTAGVQLYLSENAISLKAGDSVALPEAKAYSYSTTDKLVTNEQVSVSWESNDKTIATVANGNITGIAAGTTTITATATADGQTATETVTVTVNPNTGSKVGALLNTSSGSAWVEIDLNSVDGNQNLTKIEVKNKIEGLNPVGGGYADDKLWGAVSKDLYAFDNGVNGTKVTTMDSGDNVIDLTDAPKITTGSQSIEDPANAVFATYSGQIGVLKSGGTHTLLWDAGGDFRISAITYVGNLRAAQAGLTNCDNNTVCRVYYALSKDTANGATLRQIILVPTADANGNISYSLHGTTIGTVAEFTDIKTSGAVKSTSMDFLDMGDNGFGLLVARSDKFGTNFIYYIDLTNYSVGTDENALTVKKIGALTSVNETPINSFSALYHTDGAKMTDEQILKIAGWGQTSTDTLAPQSAPVAARAVSVQANGDTTDPAASTTKQIEVPIYAADPATNGK